MRSMGKVPDAHPDVSVIAILPSTLGNFGGKVQEDLISPSPPKSFSGPKTFTFHPQKFTACLLCVCCSVEERSIQQPHSQSCFFRASVFLTYIEWLATACTCRCAISKRHLLLPENQRCTTEDRNVISSPSRQQKSRGDMTKKRKLQRPPPQTALAPTFPQTTSSPSPPTLDPRSTARRRMRSPPCQRWQRPRLHRCMQPRTQLTLPGTRSPMTDERIRLLCISGWLYA